MNLDRRLFMRTAALAAATAVTRSTARAEIFPARPIKIVVGYSAGSAGDIVARSVGEWLSKSMNQPVVIDNRPGASGNIATEFVARASPDGYTLLWCNSANVVNRALFKDLKFDFLTDIAPIAKVSTTPLVMEVNPSFPAKTVAEFIAYAKTNPGQISMASIGNGTVQHIAGVLFMTMTGIEMIHVPYRGSPDALRDLIGGRVQVMFDTLPSSIEQIAAGKLRALAVTTTERVDALPQTPTVAESVPGYVAAGWIGVGAPKDTPPEIMNYLNKRFDAALADPEVRDRIAQLGGIPSPDSREEFARFISTEAAKWDKVITAANIKVE